MQYVHAVSRLWSLARRYGLDALIVLAALEGAIEVAVRRDSPDAPRTTRGSPSPATAVVILPLLARRRFPFAAPAAVWVLAAALSFVDGRLVVVRDHHLRRRDGAAFLLGNLRDAVQARLGLGVVLGGAAIVVYNKPDHAPGELVFIPLLFAIGWLAGFAVRERAEQAEAAEERAADAERERDVAARIAVAEERARIARELHDIVAHAVSVMVLQVGAVRHKLPEGARGGCGRAPRRRADGPHGARRDAPPPRRDAPRRRRPRARPAARPRRSRRAAGRGRPRRACPFGSTSRASPSRCRGRSTSPPTGSCRRA